MDHTWADRWNGLGRFVDPFLLVCFATGRRYNIQILLHDVLAEINTDRKCKGDINVKDWTERDAPEVKDSNQVDTYKQYWNSNIDCSKDVSCSQGDNH